MKNQILKTFILILTFISVGCSVVPGGNDWVYSYNKDPITDHEIINARLPTSQSRTLGGNNAQAGIRIGCGGNGQFVSFDYSEKTTEAYYRVDNFPSIKIAKYLNFDDVHTSVIVGEEASVLINQLKQGKKLVLRRQHLSALNQSGHYFDLPTSYASLSRALLKCTKPVD